MCDCKDAAEFCNPITLTQKAPSFNFVSPLMQIKLPSPHQLHVSGIVTKQNKLGIPALKMEGLTGATDKDRASVLVHLYKIPHLGKEV